MRRPLIGAKGFQASIEQGEQAQRRSWRLTKRKNIVCMREGGRKRIMKCEKGC
jgi:hypothetical protein